MKQELKQLTNFSYKKGIELGFLIGMATAIGVILIYLAITL